MIVCGLDPCKPFRPGPRSKKPAKLPVWAWYQDGHWDQFYDGLIVDRGVCVGEPPAEAFDFGNRVVFDLLVCERPHPHGKASAQGAITMGVWAGWLASLVQTKRTICMPPQVWKKILIPGFETVSKEMFCANIQQMFPEQLADYDPKVDADQDVIDAVGLCAVAAKLVTGGTVDKYKEWELKL